MLCKGLNEKGKRSFPAQRCRSRECPSGGFGFLNAPFKIVRF
ncbi:hypothetical protein LFADAHJC_LOCUS2555 [Methylorubrum extorquens]